MSRYRTARFAGSFFLVELATAIMFVALPLLMLERYGLGVETGVVLAAALAPQLLLAGLVGLAIRRYDAHLVAIVSSLGGVVPIVLFPLSRSVPEVSVLAFATGCALVFGVPARMSLRSRVVLAGDEVRANSLIVGAERLAMTLGPALGASLATVGGIAYLFYFDAAALAGAAGLLIGVVEGEGYGPQAFDAEPGRRRSWLRRAVIEPAGDFREMLRGKPLIGAFTATAFGYVTAVGASRLLLASRARTVFGTDASLGFLVAAMAAGGVLGAIVGGRLGRLRQGRLYVAGNLCEALCWPAVALVPSRAAVLAIMFAAGVFESIPTVVYFAEVQTRLSPLAVGNYYALLIPMTQICAMLGVLGGSALLALGGALPLGVGMACLIALPVLARARLLLQVGVGERRTSTSLAEDVV